MGFFRVEHVRAQDPYCGAPENPWGFTFCGGDFIYDPPSDFCKYLRPCTGTGIGLSGNGFVARCNDGTWTLSGGRPGRCSGHNGGGTPLYCCAVGVVTATPTFTPAPTPTRTLRPTVGQSEPSAAPTTRPSEPDEDQRSPTNYGPLALGLAGLAGAAGAGGGVAYLFKRRSAQALRAQANAVSFRPWYADRFTLEERETVYVHNLRTGRYHRLDCEWVDRTAPKNRRTRRLDTILKLGGTPCEVCRPPGR